MGEAIELTEAEKTAKKLFMNIFVEGCRKNCDYDLPSSDDGLPPWYDEMKYKRGQKYFRDNRSAILHSNLIGLIILLAEPKGLQTLISTGRSSTPETARKRYLSTIAHTLSWYEIDLTPGSKSFESLKKVRKLHFFSSKSAAAKGIGPITQNEIAFTAFGFMGFVLVRPHLLGIRHNNLEDREAFVHLWAVLCHMIGLQEHFNICLLPFDALLVMCKMIMRYLLLPIIQLETPGFKRMTNALANGLKRYLINVDIEAELFTAKKLLMVPGYQYKTDNKSEIYCRAILTQEDVDICNEVLRTVTNRGHAFLTVDIPVIEISYAKVNESYEPMADEGAVKITTSLGTAHIENKLRVDIFRNALELKSSDEITVTLLNDDQWASSLNDSKYMALKRKSKFVINLRLALLPVYKNLIGRYLIEKGLDVILYRIKKAAQLGIQQRKAEKA